MPAFFFIQAFSLCFSRDKSTIEKNEKMGDTTNGIVQKSDYTPGYNRHNGRRKWHRPRETGRRGQRTGRDRPDVYKRQILYQAPYTALIANRADASADKTVTIAGRCCESGDLLQENTPLQACEPGDTLAVLATGAYNYSMASNYNRLPRPAVVMTKDGKARVVVRAETYEDLIDRDE